MDLKDFRMLVEQLDRSFGKQYSDAHKNRIYAKMGRLTVSQGQSLIDFILDNSKFRPTPGEISEFMKQRNLHVSDDNVIRPNFDCKWCKGKGLLDIKRKSHCKYPDQLHKMFCNEERCAYDRSQVRCICPFGKSLSENIPLYSNKLKEHWEVQRPCGSNDDNINQ